MPIKVLDAAVVGRIAAGEVVERPSSVAKELIENAIDAGATAVTVEIRDGGIAMLRVTDNGCGIAPEQVAIAFENHATSKLNKAEQLDDIRTLGFRGEALPSIAAVSHVEMTTRQKGAASGVKLLIDGGIKKPVTEAGCPEGTTVIVRDLFYNVPVRRTFLKKAAYEGSLVSDLVGRMILGNPGVSFRFLSNGRTIYHSFGDSSLKHAVFAVYGSETAEKMAELDASCGGMRIKGMIGVGDLSKATRAHQAFYINGRVVRCALLTQVLEQICKGRVTIGTYPMCALTITIPPASVDVNVHPNKLEVRFRDEQSIRLSAENILAQAFAGEAVLDIVHPVPEEVTRQVKVEEKQTVVESKPTEVYVPPEERVTIPERRFDISNLTLREDIAAPMPPMPERPRPEPVKPPVPAPAPVQEKISREKPEQITLSEAQPQDTAAAKPVYRVIGTVFNTYILIELEDTMLMIDQHAAHERIMYEKFTARMKSGAPASQTLIVPVVINVSTREMALIDENKDALEKAGYQLEPFGERSISVRGVPFIMGRTDIRPIFMDMLGSLERIGQATLENRADEIATMACKAAVKAGDKLTDSEIEALIRQMLETGASPTCPHGRPVSRALTKRDVEKMFKRIQ